MNFEFTSNRLLCSIDKAIYNLDVLHKCFYWYGASFEVTIEDFSEHFYHVELLPKDDSADLHDLVFKVKRDLIDFKLRDTVTKETRIIRELLIAKAFANYDLDVENPSTELSDPVGFDPLSI